MSPRTRASAKAAGSWFERSIADYLAATVSDVIDRKVKTGAHDKGDIGGVRIPTSGARVAVEVKNYAGRFLVGEWVTEAETERINDAAAAGLVIAKRRGTTNPGDQIVFMTVRDLAALLTGTRPEDPA